MILRGKRGIQSWPGTSHQYTNGQLFGILRHVRKCVPSPKIAILQYVALMYYLWLGHHQNRQKSF